MQSVSGEVSLSDYISAQYLHWRSRIFWLRVIYVSVLVIGLISFCFYPINVVNLLLTALCLGPLLGDLINLLLVPWRTRGLYRQQKVAELAIAYSWDDTYFESKTSRSFVHKPWCDYIKAKESDKVFLLYHSDRLYDLIPKRWFGSADEISQFRQATCNVHPA